MSDGALKRILVTGANKGIGLAIAAGALSARDDTEVLLGSRDRARGDAARRELVAREPSWGERVDVLTLDVADDGSVAEAARRVIATQGGAPGTLYGLVNNAGVGGGAAGRGAVLEVNLRGPHRVCEHFLPLLQPTGGRVVNVSSASGPLFVASCSPVRQRFLTDPDITWSRIEAFVEECLALEAEGASFAACGLGDGNAYGLSKACLNAYTIALAREHPSLCINACTPGFIETDMTRPHAEARGLSPRAAGMKPPEEGARAPLFLLFGQPGGSGWYFGSDAVRSPLDRYRAPGDPPYTGD
jgi:carbonyl reductase 1